MILSPIELNNLFDRLGTPLAGRRLVEKARKDAPVRDIQANSSNVVTWYSSKKMARSIGTESRTVEFPAAVQYEYDPLVLEYYPQPCKIDLTIPSRRQHTPDFLIIRTDQIVIEEWREEGRLEQLAAKYPGRFTKEDECWHFPDIENYLAEMGITYHLRSAKEHPRQYVSNLIFLADYLSPDCPSVEQEKLDIVHGILTERPVITLTDLMKPSEFYDGDPVDADGKSITNVDNWVTSDDIYKAIADGYLTFDLMNDDLSETHRARVYRDATMLSFHQKIEASADMIESVRLDVSFAVGTEVNYDGNTYKIVFLGQKSVMLSADDGTTTELPLEVLEKQYAAGKLIVIPSVPHANSEDQSLASIGPKYLDKALERARELEYYSNVAPELIGKAKKRALQRYRKAMNEAGVSVTAQHLALVPKTKDRGNRERKIPQELIDAIETVVKVEFNNATNINKDMAYKKFADLCLSLMLKRCSRKTFYKEVDRLTSVRQRQGKRVFYQTQPIVWYLKLEEPIHGVRPFQYVHIDHTPLDILLCSPNSKKSLGKAWLSLAIDAESRRVVGFYLSFEAPSYRSCMMVLRDIVRRNGRMPDMLVVDNGKEFHSREFMRVCELYGCHIRYRPAGQPRYGSVMERLFGTTQSQLIHNLSGNTQLMKHVRTVTKSVNPNNFVEWTLPALHGALDFYFENLYGTENHPAHGEEPVRHFISRMAETGMRMHRLVRYDSLFRIETCPAPDAGGTRVVDGQRGIKINYIWYWSNALITANLHKKPVDVRIDPWDVRFVYALINGRWHKCESKLTLNLRHYTVLELRYAFQELAREYGIAKKDLSPERIAEWTKVLDAKNFDDRLKEQQAEAILVYENLGMTTADPFSTRPLISFTPRYPAESPSVGNTNILLPTDSECIPVVEEEEYELF